MRNTTVQDRADCIQLILSRLYPHVSSPLNYTHDYEFLFAVMLSAQTTDKQVNVVTARLFKKYPTLDSIAQSDVKRFAHAISSINHYKTKAQRMVKSAQILLAEYDGKVPKSIAELIKLPGVGRKSANVVMSELWNNPEGIAVDTHVIRLSKKYGLSRHRDPEKIEQDLMNVIPKREWGVFPLRLIMYGHEYCPARCKKCPACPLWKCNKKSK